MVEILDFCAEPLFDLGDEFAVDISSANINWPTATDMDAIVCAASGANGIDGDNVKIDWVRVAEQF